MEVSLNSEEFWRKLWKAIKLWFDYLGITHEQLASQGCPLPLIKRGLAGEPVQIINYVHGIAHVLNLRTYRSDQYEYTNDVPFDEIVQMIMTPPPEKVVRIPIKRSQLSLWDDSTK